MLFRGPEQNGSGLKVVEAGSTYTSDSKDEEGYCKVMLGWLTIYTSDHPESSNLGATEAVLAAYYIAENDSSDDVPVTAIVFGCPQEMLHVVAGWNGKKGADGEEKYSISEQVM
ncbi:BnaC03g23860D [Brassica napus]|nr:unnamed protein product [Brassica napus]CDY42820.1 BnaC03g23860D [Brassica napus]